MRREQVERIAARIGKCWPSVDIAAHDAAVHLRAIEQMPGGVNVADETLDTLIDELRVNEKMYTRSVPWAKVLDAVRTLLGIDDRNRPLRGAANAASAAMRTPVTPETVESVAVEAKRMGRTLTACERAVWLERRRATVLGVLKKNAESIRDDADTRRRFAVWAVDFLLACHAQREWDVNVWLVGSASACGVVGLGGLLAAELGQRWAADRDAILLRLHEQGTPFGRRRADRMRREEADERAAHGGRGLAERTAERLLRESGCRSNPAHALAHTPTNQRERQNGAA